MIRSTTAFPSIASRPTRARTGAGRWLATLAALVLFGACGTAPDSAGNPSLGDVGTEPAPSVTAPGAALIPIPNARIPVEGVLSGGQPTPEQLEAAAAAGVRTVINLRTTAEPGFEWEPEHVATLGMDYVHLPIEGADGLTRDNVEAFDAALDAALAHGPVLLHCGSGNRIGALFALEASWLEGAEADDALARGRSTGLTRLEPQVRDKLGLDETETP